MVTRQEQGAWVTLRGPETRAAAAPVPTDAEIFGIQFSHGAFMPGLDIRRLVDASLTFPASSAGTFRFAGTAWEVPRPDNADAFVERLVAAGALAYDPIVPAAIDRDVVERSTRTLERRVLRATGLTRGMIDQIQRAERAVDLLDRGVTGGEVVHLAGYADQPHMTRSLERLVGRTPSQIPVGR